MTIAHVLASGVAPRPALPRAIYRIVVRDLLLKCRIGIYDHERMAPQRVRINVDLAVSEAVGGTSDDIVNVYNYEEVISGTKAIIDAGHIDLVETLAERIAAHCLKDSRVEDVRVKVEKLDVYAEAESVGIEIERRQTQPRLLGDPCHVFPVSPLAVVKLGGSLAQGDDLKSWLAQLVSLPVVVVPGGGPFADQVRALQIKFGFSDAAAHKMALSAMEQFGRMLADLEPRLVPAMSLADISHALSLGQAALWLPSVLWDHPDIPQSWDVTSDSLAAWLAVQTGAPRMLLVKSASVSGAEAKVGDLIASGMIDRAFADFLGALDVEVVQSKDASASVAALVAKKPVGVKVVP
jgi:dihydroneopterin aldolase